MKQFTRNYILTSALYDFVFAYAIYNAYFEFKGISIDRISYLLAFWALCAMLFEIPSGALADRFSHKNMIVLAPIIKSTTFIIWAIADGNIYLYGLGFMMWALASTLRSGTMEAYLYEILKENEHVKDYERVLGIVKFTKQIAIGISMITGGIIAHFNMQSVFVFSVLPLMLSAYYALKLQPSSMAPQLHITYLGHIRNARYAMLKNSKLQILLVYGLLISLFGILEEFDQLYYKFLALPIWTYGVLAFLTSILSSFAMTKAFLLKSRQFAFITLPVLSLLSLIGVIYLPTYPSVVCLILSYVMIAPLYVLIDGRIQNCIEDASRATVTSLNGLFINMLGVVITPFFGILSRRYDITIIYWIMAVLVLSLIGFSISYRSHLH